jgi:1,4-dihydroxy-2-naphthoyl-CoA hydrolase
MMIPENVTPDMLNQWSRNTMMETLSMKFTEVGPDYVVATMPVDHRTHQPMGLLHGGASIALAETVGSSGSAMMVDREKYAVVGINMQAHHLKSIRTGTVTARGNIVHQGRSTHIWDITITGPKGEVISICRLTNFIKEIR